MLDNMDASSTSFNSIDAENDNAFDDGIFTLVIVWCRYIIRKPTSERK